MPVARPRVYAVLLRSDLFAPSDVNLVARAVDAMQVPGSAGVGLDFAMRDDPPSILAGSKKRPRRLHRPG